MSDYDRKSCEAEWTGMYSEDGAVSIKIVVETTREDVDVESMLMEVLHYGQEVVKHDMADDS
jgi:hypothetical protein